MKLVNSQTRRGYAQLSLELGAGVNQNAILRCILTVHLPQLPVIQHGLETRSAVNVHLCLITNRTCSDTYVA